MQDSELQYHGDAGKWKLDFIERATEVFQSEVTPGYWMMNCAFKSFEGKNTQIQSMIVGDINNKDVVRSGMSVDALANKYAEYVATPNAGQVANKDNAQSDYNARPRDEERRKPKTKTNGPLQLIRPT